jgi:hypothetical protein
VSASMLTTREQYAVLALMAIGREANNHELMAVAGLEITGDVRRSLNAANLVVSRRDGRGYVHELSDEGWEWCESALSADRPARANHQTAVLFAILDGLGRYLATNVVPVSAVFQPDVEAWIRAVYARSAATPAAWVRLVTVRDALHGVSRDMLDDALDRMVDQPDVHLRAETDEGLLTDDDRKAAVKIGGETLHLLRIGSA